MAHIRKLIRDNIETTLTGLATTGSNVFGSRVYPIQSARMPGLCVYTSSETIEAQTIKPPRGLIRSLEVSVEAYVESATADDVLDQIAAEVEAAMAPPGELALALGVDVSSAARGRLKSRPMS